MRGKLLVKDLSGFGGVEDEQAAVGGVCANMGDECRVIEFAEVCGFDTFEGLEKCGFVVDDWGYFLRWNADSESVSLIEGGLGGGAEDGGATEIFDETSETAEDGVKETGWEGLRFIKNDNGASDAMELAARGGSIGIKGLEELDVGGDDDRCVPVLAG